MSFLTDGELESVRIERMIVHVIGGKKDFEPQPEMPIAGLDHIDFFLARIEDAAVSAVHQFHPNSTTKIILEKMADRSLTFEAGSQELARQFGKDHVAASRGGAFFVFELGTDDPSTRLYSLIKYDYREAIELYAEGGKNALRQIVQAFVKERKAIQKSALVRIKNGKADLVVSAFDRMGNSPDLTDYFQKFLDVYRDRDAKELSGRLNEVLRKTLQLAKSHLPAGDVPRALGVAKEYLRQRENVDDESIREAIFASAEWPDEDSRTELDRHLSKQMRELKLTGITFKPDPDYLKRAPRRKIKTAEDIILEYPGEQENRAVVRKRDPEGGWTITIKTSKGLIEDETISDKARREA